jgi:hypothetical protein
MEAAPTEEMEKEEKVEGAGEPVGRQRVKEGRRPAPGSGGNEEEIGGGETGSGLPAHWMSGGGGKRN